MTMKPKITFIPLRLLINLLWVYLTYIICQIAFVLENLSTFSSSLTPASCLDFFIGGLHFSTSAICYTNIPFMLLFLTAAFLPKLKPVYLAIVKWLFVIVNGLCAIINLADATFFSFRLQRTTAAFFSEFQGEGNLMKIGGMEMVSHWYFIILAVAIFYLLARLYMRPVHPYHRSPAYYIANGLSVVIIGMLYVSGMRGSSIFAKATRPISVNDAFRYTTSPTEAGIVLNTPFTILRTMSRRSLPTPEYFQSEEELAAIYTPLHTPASIPDSVGTPKKKNVVILIMESFAKEFMGYYNRGLDSGTYKGYTPYLDAMVDSCMWFDETIANTFYSIDAPPAVLASIPRAESPFVVSTHSVNSINSLASELKNIGYSSAFFHGAPDGSLGIESFTKQAGFDSYFGQEQFYEDSRFGGKEEFDGTWGIWDEPFLQYFCAKLGEMKQPFIGSVFTLSSHHPFKVPEKYKDVFTDEGEFELHKAIKYSDYALHRFFETARKQAWFGNTIFVICADHTSSKRTHVEYKNEMGNFRIPILIYDPSGDLPRGRQPGIMQQIDIMPTLLNHIGYDRPYIAFGKDVLHTAPEDTWAVNWNDLPTYIKGDYLMILDGDKVKGMYNYKTDPDSKLNLYGKGLPEEKDMETHLKAFVQSYLSRMNTDNVTVKK